MATLDGLPIDDPLLNRVRTDLFQTFLVSTCKSYLALAAICTKLRNRLADCESQITDYENTGIRIATRVASISN
jgi:hypothetical protein